MGRGVALPVVSGVEVHRCHHVEQEPGSLAQAAGDLGVVVIHSLEASHDNLEEIEVVSALLADVDHALLVDEHDGLCRRAELISDTIRIHRHSLSPPLSVSKINALPLVNLLFESS